MGRVVAEKDFFFFFLKWGGGFKGIASLLTKGTQNSQIGLSIDYVLNIISFFGLKLGCFGIFH